MVDRIIDFVKAQHLNHTRDYVAQETGSNLSVTQWNALSRVEDMCSLRRAHISIPARTKIAFRAFSEVSASCKYLMNKEFPGTSSGESGPPVATDLGTSCAHQAAALYESIANEHEMLSLNWIHVGRLLDEFVEQLFVFLGISPLIEEYGRVMPCNPSFNEIVVRRDIGNRFLMDSVFYELNFEENEEACIASKKAAEFMMEYFSTVANRDALTFF